jgi:hypothetical protein
MPPKSRREVGEATASSTCKCKKSVCGRCWKCVSCPGGCKCSPEKVVRKKRVSREYTSYGDSPASTVKERHAKIARETNNKPSWESAATTLAQEYETPFQIRIISSITASKGHFNGSISSTGSRNTRGNGGSIHGSSIVSNGTGCGGRLNQVITKIKVVTTASELKSALKHDIVSSKNHNMPSEKIRVEKRLDDIDKYQSKRIIAFAAVAVQSIYKLLLPNDDEKLAEDFFQKLSNNDKSHSKSALFDNLKELEARLPPKSLQRFALLAPACETFKEEKLRHEFGIVKKQIISSQLHFRFMKEGNAILPQVRLVVRYDEQCVRRAVDYIFSDINVQHVSWGTKRIIIVKKEVIFPRLIRLRNVHHLLMGYIDLYPKDQRIGNTSFKLVAKSITCNDQKEKNAVDYLSGILLYGNFMLMHRICANTDAFDELLKVLNALDAFLKGPYDDRARNIA